MTRTLFVCGIPLALAVGALVLVATYKPPPAVPKAAPAQLSPAEAARERAQEREEERRRFYFDCLRKAGGYGNGVRTRFSRRPSADRLREASDLCRTLVLLPPASPSAPAGPGVAPVA